MPVKKGEFLSLLRFLIFVEAGIATIVYLLYIPQRYFSACDVESASKVLCPVPSFALQPHQIFYVMIDLLVVTAIVYVLYAFYMYLSVKKKQKNSSSDEREDA